MQPDSDSGSFAAPPAKWQRCRTCHRRAHFDGSRIAVIRGETVRIDSYVCSYGWCDHTDRVPLATKPQ
jgi:hypothetical protein